MMFEFHFFFLIHLFFFFQNLDEVLEKIQNLKFDEQNFKINPKKSRESKMIVLKNIPFKLKSDELTELIVKNKPIKLILI